MGLTALCPGTFDPVTNGHLDVVGRAAQLFDSVIVGVVENPSKTPLFSVDERVRLLEEALKDLSNVRVGSLAATLISIPRPTPMPRPARTRSPNAGVSSSSSSTTLLTMTPPCVSCPTRK